MYPGGQSPAQRQDRAHRNVQATRNYLLYVESSKCKSENDDDDDESNSSKQQQEHHQRCTNVGEVDLDNTVLPFSFDRSGSCSPDLLGSGSGSFNAPNGLLQPPSGAVPLPHPHHDVGGDGSTIDANTTVVAVEEKNMPGTYPTSTAAAAAFSSSPLTTSTSATQRVPKNSKLSTSASLKPKVNILTDEDTSLFQRKEQVTIMHELGKSRVLRYEEAVLSGQEDLEGDVGIGSDNDDDNDDNTSSSSKDQRRPLAVVGSPRL